MSTALWATNCQRLDLPRTAPGVKKMRVFLITSFFFFASGAAMADDAQSCQANQGTFVTGTILGDPSFVPGHDRNGVELSHTRLTVKADDGTIYDVRADNVFASGYDKAGETVPAPLSALKPGNRIELCGDIYTTDGGGAGLHWVHTDCGDPPEPGRPEGWLKIVEPDALPGPNLEGSTEYCSLWQ
jgi:hypothetical protein